MLLYAEEYLTLHNQEIRNFWEGRAALFFDEMLRGNHGEWHDSLGDCYEIEIRGRQSTNGNPILFQFPKKFVEDVYGA